MDSDHKTPGPEFFQKTEKVCQPDTPRDRKGATKDVAGGVGQSWVSTRPLPTPTPTNLDRSVRTETVRDRDVWGRHPRGSGRVPLVTPTTPTGTRKLPPQRYSQTQTYGSPDPPDRHWVSPVSSPPFALEQSGMGDGHRGPSRARWACLPWSSRTSGRPERPLGPGTSGPRTPSTVRKGREDGTRGRRSDRSGRRGRSQVVPSFLSSLWYPKVRTSITPTPVPRCPQPPPPPSCPYLYPSRTPRVPNPHSGVSVPVETYTGTGDGPAGETREGPGGAGGPVGALSTGGPWFPRPRPEPPKTVPPSLTGPLPPGTSTSDTPSLPLHERGPEDGVDDVVGEVGHRTGLPTSRGRVGSVLDSDSVPPTPSPTHPRTVGVDGVETTNPMSHTTHDDPPTVVPSRPMSMFGVGRTRKETVVPYSPDLP